MVSSDGWLWVFRGGVGLLLLAALLFLLGFATNYWHDDDVTRYGLWETCTGGHCSSLDGDELPAYRIATQAFQILAVAFYGLSPVLHLVFYCSKKKKDTGWRSRILDVGYSIGIVFHVCSVVIFGLENPTPENFSWSFNMSCASCGIAFLGIFLVIISRNRALHKFTFRAVNRSKRKTNIAMTTGDGRSATPPSSRPHERPSFGRSPLHPPSPAPSSSSSPGTNINITVNINTKPPGAEAEATPSSKPPHPPNHPPPPPFFNQSQQGVARPPPPMSETHTTPDMPPDMTHPPYNSEHSLTQVRPAPKSSVSHYTSPTHKKVFGPADRKRTLELLDSVSPYPPGGAVLPAVAPSAPPSEAANLEERPPSYAEAMSTDKPGL